MKKGKKCNLLINFIFNAKKKYIFCSDVWCTTISTHFLFHILSTIFSILCVIGVLGSHSILSPFVSFSSVSILNMSLLQNLC